MGKATDQRSAIAGLELMQLRTVDDASNDLAHIKGFAGIGRDNPVQLFRYKFRSYRCTQFGSWSLFLIQMRNRLARE